jgi:predicted MFS family arabinose efflux permease
MVENTKTTSRFLAGLSIGAFFNRAQQLALVILFPAIRDSLGLNYLSLAILETLRLVIQAAGDPLWKLATGRGNRKWLLAACTGFWGIWTLGCGLAANFWQLLIVRILACLGFGCLFPLALDLLQDIFDSNDTARVMNALQVSGMFGAVIMAIVLAELLNITAIGWRYGFVILGSLAILAGGAIAILVKNPSPPTTREGAMPGTPGEPGVWIRGQFQSLGEILKRPTVWLHFLQGSLVTTTVNTLLIFSVTWLVDIKHMTQIDAPFIFGGMLVFMAVGSQVGVWATNLAETRWPRIGRTAATQAAMLLVLPVLYYLVLKAQSLPVIMAAAIFVSFFLKWNQSGLQKPQIEAIMPPELQSKATFWIELVQAVFAAVAILGFSHYADNRNLTAMLRVLGIDFWGAALILLTAYYFFIPAELRRLPLE